MTLSRSLLLASVLTAATLTLAPLSVVHADETLGGNPVPGLCMISREAVFAQTKVGQAASEHLKQLAEQEQNQLGNERGPLQSDIQKFQQEAPKLAEAQRKQQGQALQQRMQQFQQKAGELNERIQLTRSKVMQRIGQEAEPIVASAYKSHGCGLLLNRDAVLGGNVSNDLTPDVVKGLDAKITSLSFNLEPLPPQSKGGK
ncbi:MAG: OmpH family outer membrane protein [Xanthomonadaceae bacterium]|nr:OmpH family outer membrane protein [Xanthomonadaceae bacterium]MDE1965057.1 OmpH family outer membrane protein [Xanthomonadaceae bacterium]